MDKGYNWLLEEIFKLGIINQKELYKNEIDEIIKEFYKYLETKKF